MKRSVRNLRLYLRVTSKEYTLIKMVSELSGLSISEYMRRRAYNIRIVAKSDIHVLKELRRLGGLIKHLYNETHGIYSSQMADALEAITSYAHALERKIS